MGRVHPPETDLVEEEARLLAEEDGIAWDRLTEDYESPLNEFTSKSMYRRKAMQKLSEQS